MPKIAVVGAGTMGNGIAQVFAAHGNDVTLIDVQQAALDKGIETIKGSLARVVKKGTITEADAAATVGRITSATDLSAAAT
jgi:3-hydroxybutyryl-CoA dehydrogenase